MATKTATPSDEAPEALAANPRARPGYWVYAKGVAATGGRMGVFRLAKATGDALVTAGQAVSVWTKTKWPYREGHEPGGYPYVPTPPPVVTVAITAISAENPAKATISTGDMAKLSGKTKVTISGAGGTGAGSVNKQFTIGTKTATTFVLTGLDNSVPLTITGYPLTGTLAA